MVKRRDRTANTGARPRVRRAELQAGFLVRIFLLASIAVGGSVWALVRFYTRVRPPMVVPVAPSGGEWGLDGGVGIIPAPEIEVEGH